MAPHAQPSFTLIRVSTWREGLTCHCSPIHSSLVNATTVNFNRQRQSSKERHVPVALRTSRKTTHRIPHRQLFGITSFKNLDVLGWCELLGYDDLVDVS